MPIYLFIFLGFAFPFLMPLLNIKRGLLICSVLVISLSSLFHRRLYLNRTIIRWSGFYALLGLFVTLHGLWNNTPGWLKEGFIYFICPIFYIIMISGAKNWKIWSGIHFITSIAGLIISLKVILLALSSLNLIPTEMGYILPIDVATEGFGTKAGNLASSVGGLNSLGYILPYTIGFFFSPKGYRSHNTPIGIKHKFIWTLLCLEFLAAFISGRRGLIIVALFVSLLTFLIVSKIKDQFAGKKIAKTLAVIIVFFVLALASLEYLSRYLPDANSSSRLTSYLFSFQIDDNVRLEQARYLFNGFLEKPVFGAGLGASHPFIQRSYAQPWSYELHYHQLLYQTGIIGVFSYFLGIIYIIFRGFSIAKKDEQIRPLIIGSLMGMIGILLVNGTNPVLARFDCLWPIFIPVGLINYWYFKKRFELQR